MLQTDNTTICYDNNFILTDNFLQNCHIGYMEDHKVTRQTTKSGIEKRGVKVSIVDDEESVFNFANTANWGIPIFLLDIHMGENRTKEGIRFSRKIRNRFPHAVVILLSSELNSLSGKETTGAKADEILEKSKEVSDDVDRFLSVFTANFFKQWISKYGDGRSINDLINLLEPAKKITLNTSPCLFDDFLKNNTDFFESSSEIDTSISDLKEIIQDDFIDFDILKPKIISSILHIRINSKQPLIWDQLDNFLQSFSKTFLLLPVLNEISQNDLSEIGILALHTKSGVLRSFGIANSIEKNVLTITPGILDLFDPNKDSKYHKTSIEFDFGADLYLIAVIP